MKQHRCGDCVHASWEPIFSCAVDAPEYERWCTEFEPKEEKVVKRACKDCEFSAAPAGEGRLQCRHKSPLWALGYPMPCPGIDFDVMATMPQNSRIWPAVKADDWCGEFQPREEAVPVDVVKKFSRCFAELSVYQDEHSHEPSAVNERLSEVLADVNGIIDLPAAVDELKKEST